MRWDTPARTSNPEVLVELARKAVAVRPDAAGSWELLARSLSQIGKDEEAIAILTDAIAKLPAAPKFPLMLADAYFRAGRIDLAEQVLRLAPAIPGDDRNATLSRLKLLIATGIANDAGQIAHEALALDPACSEAVEVLAKAARRDSRPEVMIPICRAALKRETGHVRARYELAVAYAGLGCPEEARRLIDLDRFVTVTEVEAPREYAGAGAFEAALSGEIVGNPTLKPDPAGKTTKGGLQTSGSLAHASGPAIGALLDRIRSAVDVFGSSLPSESEDPFVKMRPQEAWLDAWAVVYSGDGYQISHIHPSGWLSGVYFVSAPKAPVDDRRGGCLVLGSLDHAAPPWGLRDIYPAPGQLVLFPSFFPHATVPIRSPERKISIAFDVVPIRPDRTPVD